VPVQSASVWENSKYEFSEELKSGEQDKWSETSGARGSTPEGWKEDNWILLLRATGQIFIQYSYIFKDTSSKENKHTDIKIVAKNLGAKWKKESCCWEWNGQGLLVAMVLCKICLCLYLKFIWNLHSGIWGWIRNVTDGAGEFVDEEGEPKEVGLEEEYYDGCK
jgi:hypothetical protein